MVPDTSSRPLIILNRNANRGRASSLAATISGICGELGTRTEIAELSSVADAVCAVHGAAREGRPIVACGGDGTVHTVASALLNLGCPVPLGIVPAGSGNDYARHALRLPSDLRSSLHVALLGSPRPVDAARINNGWMINAFGAGIDAGVAWDVREMVESGRARFGGNMLYTISAIKQILMHYHLLPSLEITVDGRRIPRRRMLLAAVMLGPTAGGGYRLAPGADPFDGLLDLMLSLRMRRAKALLALPLAPIGRHTWMREVKIIRSREIQIRSLSSVKAHIDGELVTDHSFDIQIVPGALTVMMPA